MMELQVMLLFTTLQMIAVFVLPAFIQHWMDLRVAVLALGIPYQHLEQVHVVIVQRDTFAPVVDKHLVLKALTVVVTVTVYLATLVICALVEWIV